MSETSTETSTGGGGGPRPAHAAAPPTELSPTRAFLSQAGGGRCERSRTPGRKMPQSCPQWHRLEGQDGASVGTEMQREGRGLDVWGLQWEGSRVGGQAVGDQQAAGTAGGSEPGSVPATGRSGPGHGHRDVTCSGPAESPMHLAGDRAQVRQGSWTCCGGSSAPEGGTAAPASWPVWLLMPRLCPVPAAHSPRGSHLRLLRAHGTTALP